MSQFRVQKVTKVRGLSELSPGKVGSSEASKKPRSVSANSDRPQVQPRQKKNSAGKSTEGKVPTDTKSSPASDKTGPPRPSTRSKATTGRKSSTKTCPSQQDKKNGDPKTGSSKGKAAVEGPKLPPRPSSTATKSKTASSHQSPPKRPEIKKESSYDASCSDSDEQGSREKLSPDGDFGYETGSYDDSDVSNNELLSPKARDENKNLLSGMQPPGNDPGYAYAAVEFRPLIVQDAVGVAAPVETRHPNDLQVEGSAGSNERLSYAYAEAEFRPLIIDDAVGIAAPVNSKRQTDADAPPVPERRRAPMTYEEVEVSGGEFDRTNINMMPAKDDPESRSSNSNYTEVMVESNTPSLPTRERGQFGHDEDTKGGSNGASIIGQDLSKDVYAEIQKPKRKKSDENSAFETKPLCPLDRGSSTGSFYESITGELEDMIKACDKDAEGKTSRSGSSEGAPPIPKPYLGAGPVSPTAEAKPPFVAEDVASLDQNGEDATSDMPVYAAIQKKPKDKPKQKVEERPESSSEVPPPLPNRLVLDDNDTLGRGTAPVRMSGLGDLPELPKRPEMGFLNKHRRKLSDGNFALSSENISIHNHESFPKKKGHRRSRSQDDVIRVINSTQDFRTKEIRKDDLFGKERSRSGNSIVEPYLAVDVSDPPKTPKEFKSRFTQPWDEDGTAEYELPDGWKEVESENGTKYYWHVASGTTQWAKPQVATRPKVLSFPIHSMGWVELEENQVAPHNMSESIADCISTLAKKRNDLWNTTETWGEGKDIRLLLEGDTLKLVEPRNKITLLVQPVSKMRVWGVGKEDHRDFAYVARDPQTSKHKCHMFRCHGNISGRAITNALHEMCNKILEEKRRVQEIVNKNSQPKPWSDIINTPPPPTAKEHAGFNEKPHREQKKTFTAKFLGSTDVNKPSGMDMLTKAISKVSSKGGPMKTVIIEVTVSSVKITDCTSQEVIAEDRVRFLSFMGVGKDDRLCGYVMADGPDGFVCHVFYCTPNAGTLTKALEEACQLRYQKCLDAHPELATKVPTQEVEKVTKEKDKEKDKGNFISSMQGLLGKLGTRKGGGKKDDSSSVSSPPLPKPTHTFMVKYYGALPVAVGTGIETVQEAAKHLTGGTLLICQLDVAINGITLYDSQRSALSRRHMDADTISYCGLTSTNSHFGLIQSQGGGKYICHVFSEYKTKAGPIVSAIQETL